MGNTLARKYGAAKIFLTFTFVLAACGYAAPTCKPEKILYREVGLCNPDGNVSKWDCPNCPPGSGLSVECGRTYKAGTVIDCVPCIKGYNYSTTNDIGQCKPCGKCQENEDQTGNCDVDKNTINCICKVGYYREKVLSKDCKPCSWCCDDGSNNKMPECNHQQVQPGKQCSFQDNQLCAPTTTTTNTPTQTTTHQKSISVTTVPATTLAEDSGKGNSSNTVSTDSQSESTTKSIVPIKNTPTASKKKDFWITNILFPIVIGLSSVIIVLLILAGLVIYLKSWRKKSGKSIEPIPTDSVDVSTSTTEQGFDETGALTSLPVNTKSDAENNPNDNGHVDLCPNDGTAAFHVDQVVPLLTGTAADAHEGVETRQEPNNALLGTTKRCTDDELSFICKNLGLGPKVEDLNYEVMQMLCKMLRVPVKDKDYRNLDSFCKLDYYTRKCLEMNENPVKDIIDVMVSQSTTLRSFLDELYNISRGDVVEALLEMAKSK